MEDRMYLEPRGDAEYEAIMVGGTCIGYVGPGEGGYFAWAVAGGSEHVYFNENKEAAAMELLSAS